MERQISDQFEEYWESTGVTILNDLWREKWGEYIAEGDDKQEQEDDKQEPENDKQEPESVLSVEEQLAKLSVDDVSKSFATPDESLDDLDSASDVAKSEMNSSKLKFLTHSNFVPIFQQKSM